MPLYIMLPCPWYSFFFFFNDTATTEIYTLSLHDALPISGEPRRRASQSARCLLTTPSSRGSSNSTTSPQDRKSTRLNSSHGYISYAVFCLKKKKKYKNIKKETANTTTLLLAHSQVSGVRLESVLSCVCISMACPFI